MKKLIKKIWNAIKRIFNKIDGKTKIMIPIAVKVGQALKKFMDSPIDEILENIITDVIPGDADDVLAANIRNVVEEWLPKLLVELTMMEGVSNIDDPKEKLKAILAKLKLSSKETRNVVYHGLVSLILEKLSEGILDWSESLQISEYYYKYILKK